MRLIQLILASVAFIGVVRVSAQVPIAPDPLKARVHKLKNGLTVYISVNKAEPRIYTAVAVKAGSKNDPPDNTGLAHYLEHMLFKGTDKYGTHAFSKENKEIQVIYNLYDKYNKTTDSTARKIIYKAIDSVSSIAARYAIPNEFDKLCAAIGAKGTNAYTSTDQTVYINDIPANQLEKWVILEAERFRKPVMRLFHTELEAVYEEKNMSLDSDGNLMWETLMAELFKNHAYGTQTTIGTIEHLKNPSLRKIEEYYYTYYVPNNMAICLAGDVNPDEVIALIEKYFGNWPSKPVPEYSYKPELELRSPVVKDIYGPEAEQLMLGFRFPGIKSRDALVLTLIDMILANSQAGLIDLNINKAQKALSAYSYTNFMKDYTMLILGGQPKEGQKLEEVTELLLGEIEKVKKGQFDKNLIDAIVLNMHLDRIRGFRKNNNRVMAFVEAFTNGFEWPDYVNRYELIKNISADEIMRVANSYFDRNYVVVYKRTGQRQTPKIEKPEITPVSTNTDRESAFAKTLKAQKTKPIQPRFINYEKDITQTKTAAGQPLYYVQNTEDELFNLVYWYDFGTYTSRTLGLAATYAHFLGTKTMTANALAQQLYTLGCSFNITTDPYRTYLTISGTDKNFDKAVQLFEDYLTNLEPDENAFNQLVNDELKSREDAKKDKDAIFYALATYGKFGPQNPLTFRLKSAELKALKPQSLVDELKSLRNKQHSIQYYGPKPLQALKPIVEQLHNAPISATVLTNPQVFTPLTQAKTNVLFMDYDMVQADVQWISRGHNFEVGQLPVITMYNEYFGGGMSGLVFQQIREARALAYSTYASFSAPVRKTEPFMLTAYVGTQADKLADAMAAMTDLLNNLPNAPKNFEAARLSIINRLAANRIPPEQYVNNMINAQDLGLNTDRNKAIYELTPKLTLADVQAFQQKYIKNRAYTIVVIGKKSVIDPKVLEKYGTVTELTLQDVFGE